MEAFSTHKFSSQLDLGLITINFSAVMISIRAKFPDNQNADYSGGLSRARLCLCKPAFYSKLLYESFVYKLLF